VNKPNLKTVSFLCILIISIVDVQGQTLLAEFELPSKKIDNIQSYASGNKIFLSYDDHSADDTKVFYRIDSLGKSIRFSNVALANAVACGVTNSGDNNYLYFLEGKGKLVVRAMLYNNDANKFNVLPDAIEVTGELLGTWADENLYLVLYNKEMNQLEVRAIYKMKLLSQKTFVLPMSFKPYYKDAQFISERFTSSIGSGASKVKLYHKGKYLYITIDQNYISSSVKVKPETTVLKFNVEDGSQSIQRINSGTHYRFTSFLYNDDKVYRATNSRGSYELRIFDLLTKKMVAETKIPRDTALRDSLIYTRSGKSSRIMRKESFSRMMKISSLCEPALIVYPENDSSTTILWGNYLMDKGIAPAAGINSLAGVLSMVIVTAIKQMQEPPGLARYFYINDTHTSGIGSLRKKIDNYEISLEMKKEFYRYKGYFDYGNGAVGVYQDARNAKLRLIKY
jgi:hypothetical protein